MTRVLIYNSKTHNNNFHLILALRQAFLLVPNVESQLASSDSIGLHLKEFRPDIVLVFGGESLSEDHLRLIKQESVKWVLWTTEDPFEIERNKRIAKYFDVVFTSDYASRALYDHPQCRYLPLAGDRKLFCRPVIGEPEQLRYDLVFIGTAWPNRSEFLADLIKRVREYGLRSRFVLPTNQYIPANSWEQIPLHSFERNFRLSPEDMATLQNRSNFALTLFRDFSSDGQARSQTSPTNRFYETALAGTAQIVVSDEIDILNFYPDLEGSVNQCQTSREVVEVLLQAKASLERRNRQAHQIQKFVLDKHLYENRVKEILRIT